MFRLCTLVFFIINVSISSANDSLTRGDWYRPPVLTTWQWQLDGKINTSYSAEVYDIDLFNASPTLIKELQTKERKVICYFSAGSVEDWRPDSKQFKDSDIGKPMDGWPGERWLDIRSSAVHSIMIDRLDLAVKKGCDGVEPDNVDGYTDKTGFSLTMKDQLAFNRLIANEAHSRNLSIGLKNAYDQIEHLVDYFDFAVNEECFEYSECEQVSLFIKKGKAVFNAEYKKKWVKNKKAQKELCKASIKRKFHTLVLPLGLDDQFRISCL